MKRTIEQRVDALERQSVSDLARINAHEKLLLSAYAELILQMKDPLGYIAEAKALYTSEPSTPMRPFPGVDPAFLDLVSAELDKAMADILGTLEDHVRTLLAANSGPEGAA